MKNRIVDDEITLVRYYPNYKTTLAWYQNLDLCKQVDNRDTVYDLDPSVYATKVERAVETPTPTPDPAGDADDVTPAPTPAPVQQYGMTDWIVAGAIVVVGCGLVVLLAWLALRKPKK